ncbi:MAG: hypothetical protein AAFO81_06175 [Pseudomonadota bacterium]
MTRARKHLVCAEQTPYYLITARCVRRAFLCGEDRVTGNSYEHRRGWIEDRMRALSSLFSIEICAYAIMSNHYHLVVRLNAEDINRWSSDEVLNRWTSLFKGTLLVQRYRSGAALSSAQQQSLDDTVAIYRQRLGSLSWFMKCLNEPIARRANAEDHCTGHFWEARFHSKALHSDRALITAMGYVDLNPVRAGMVNAVTASDYTSVRSRMILTHADIESSIQRLLDSGELLHFSVPVRPLAAFASTQASWHDDHALPLRKDEYLDLLEATGRYRLVSKRGGFGNWRRATSPRVVIDAEQWLSEVMPSATDAEQKTLTRRA